VRSGFCCEPTLIFAVYYDFADLTTHSQLEKSKLNLIRMGDWELLIEDGSVPPIFASYLEKAEFVDQFDVNDGEGRFLFLGVSKGETTNGWPTIIATQKYQDCQQTFSPGFLLVPDTSLIFVGAGKRLLCYNVEQKIRLWEDETLCGFWRWSQSGSFVLMSAELEFGVWNQSGEKLWSTFVEPPWTFKVTGQTVELDVMGKIRNYCLLNGVQID
jgi:hypothetical protein